ncbi:MAG: T9SS type A sorting domain-containing protein, partial [Bacteroidales bacterium]|nr:T9SS type A sorting domain-containing protein [Bacteroidales bacterium]
AIFHIDNGSIVGVEEPKFQIQDSKFQISCYPNPTSGIVEFRFSNFDFRWVSLKIYDVRGREVAVVVDGRWAGDQVVRWDASGLPAGIYFYQLRAKGEGLLVTGKILKY